MTVDDTDGATADVVLVGGGLASLLIAWRLGMVRPDVRCLIVERGPVLGGNHTWSFHASDLAAEADAWVAPLVDHSWPCQEVRFAGQPARVLRTGYRSITSDSLAARVAALPSVSVLTDATAAEVYPGAVLLDGGRRIDAPLVIDARGALRDQPLALAFQKFVGLEIETAEPHGERHPVIMDATVAQHDGYRFVYTLPLTPTRILVEDTYYSDAPALADATVEARVRSYVADRGWTIASVPRSERGVLPITLAGDIDAHWRALGPDLPRAGLRAWLFHATTGYSLPYAVRLADEIAAARDLTSPAIARLIERMSRQVWRDQAFMRLVNRLLFVGARPDERLAVMARFYRLGEGLIERFYAGRPSLADKARILSGRPPIPISRGLRVIPPERAWAFVAARGKLTTKLG